MSSQKRSDFGEAVRLLLAESRLQLRDHCTLAQLESYRRGTLSPAQQDQVAEHLAACEDCTILLLYAVLEPMGAEPAPELPKHEIEEAWNRLRPRLETKAPQGRLLSSLIADHRLALGEALPLTLGISRALLLLHSTGRAHPDLRAENVLIADSGQVRLLERGFAPTAEILDIGFGRSAEAAVLDLYRSLSPEQVAGEEPDQRSNLFSLGALLYELLTGVAPFRAQTPLETASRILSLEPVAAHELNPALAPALSHLLGSLLAKEPAERPPSTATVVCTLESTVDPHGCGSLPPPSSPEDEIEHLYDQLIALAEKQIADGRPRDQEIERTYVRLQELQTAAARDFRTRFEASLAMPIDAGERILERARTLRQELEGLTAADPAARQADGP